MLSVFHKEIQNDHKKIITPAWDAGFGGRGFSGVFFAGIQTKENTEGDKTFCSGLLSNRERKKCYFLTHRQR